MFSTTLIAHSNRTMIGELADCLRELAEQGVLVDPVHDPAQDVEEAKQRYARQGAAPYELVIIDAKLRRHWRQPVDAANYTGVELLQDWHEHGYRPAIILVSDEDSPALLLARRPFPLCELLLTSSVDDDIGVGLRTAIERLLQTMPPASEPGSPRTEKPMATIEIDLTHQTAGPRAIGYRIEFHEPNSTFCRPPRPGVLMLHNPSRFEDLISEMRCYRPMMQQPGGGPPFILQENWFSYLRRLGEDLFEQLITQELRDEFTTAKALCGGLNRVGIRFVVDEKHYPAPIEALYDGSLKNFLMLEAPITRRVPERIPREFRSPWAGRHERVRFLCIVADVGEDHLIVPPPGSAFPDVFERLSFDTLRNLKDELSYFEDLRQRLANRLDIRIIPDPHNAAELARPLRTLLEETLLGKPDEPPPRWDYVHFAGHSWFHDSPLDEFDRGYLILGHGSTTLEADALALGEFARWLDAAQTRLAYLSSCCSSSTQTAFEMASCGVPAILGFRWDLDDAHAVEFARGFYDRLFGRACTVPEAFFETRRALFGENRERNPIWAAPILLAQTRDWHAAVEA